MQSNTISIIIKLMGKTYNYIILRLFIKISDFCISKYLYGFLTDFMECVRDFRVIGDPSGKAMKATHAMFFNVLYYTIFAMFSGFLDLYLKLDLFCSVKYTQKLPLLLQSFQKLLV